MRSFLKIFLIAFLFSLALPFRTFSQTLFSENFESAGVQQTQLSGTAFIGWKNFNVNGNNNYWWIFNNTRCGVISGTYSMAISKNSPATTGTLPQYKDNTIANQVAYFGTPINAVGYINVKLNFNWKCYGEVSGSNYYDYGRVCYSLNGTTWTDFPTTAYYYGQTSTQSVTNLDISVVNNTQFYLGFRWINDASNSNNPPFIIDDISVTASPASPMTFTSCTTTQNNVSSVLPGATNQEIIGIQIVTSGSSSPVSATQFTVNANGSTNINDINAVNSAKIYYTGSSSTFAITNLFGQATPTIADFTINGSQTLSPGTNYFWLVYDVKSGATYGDVVDGQCTSLNVNGVRTPTVTSPAGNRTIALTYCTNTNTSSTSYYINNFSTSGGATNITNSGSGFSANGYGNFTAMTVSTIQGSNINFSINVLAYTMGIGIWVDWNQDGDFADVGEQVFMSSNFVTSATGNIAVPATALTGNTRMRVVADDFVASPAACPGTTSTECEDYTFNVIALTTCSGTPNAGIASISQAAGCGSSNITLSATGVSMGSGISYQWQTSADGVSGWVNIMGATTTSLSTSTASTSFYRLMTTCSNSGLSNYSNVASFTLTTCSSINLPSTGSNSVFCGTNTTIYDDGGSASDYGPANSGYTVLENSGTGVITISGTYTGIETCCDHLNIFSGVGTGGTLLYTYGSLGSGNITTFSSPVGTAITIQFTSDGSGQGAGFALQAIYLGACTPCVGNPNAGVAAISSSTGCFSTIFNLSATGLTGGFGISYHWQISANGSTGWSDIPGATSTSLTTSTATTAYYRLMTNCSPSGFTNYTNVVSYTTINCTNINVPATGFGTVSCGTNANLYDNGGSAGNYAASSNGYTVFENNGSGIITVSGSYTGIESCCDYLRIYSGTGTGGTLLAAYSGTGTVTPVSSAAAQAITIQFTSDNSNQGEGFALQVNYTGACVVCAGTPVAGSSVASPASICIGSSSTLTVSGYSLASGISFQWQSSASLSGPYTDIAGANGTTCVVTPLATTYYRCKVNCVNSGLNDFTVGTPVNIISQANDLPCNAQTLLIGDLTPADNTCASGTGEPSAPSCWYSGALNTVWYKFQAPASGSVKIKTIVGTLLNTQIAVYSGSCGSGMTFVGCNDDVPACGTSAYLNSELALSALTPGAWYYIVVDGYSSLTGTFSIVWIDGSSPWPAVPGQDCISGVPVCASTFTVGNPGYQAVGNICDFPGSNGNCLLSGERGSAWYEIMVNADGNLMFTIEPNDAIADGSGLITDDGTDYDFGIWKKTGSGAVNCTEIANGSLPLACNYSSIGISGLYTGGTNPLYNNYTGHLYTATYYSDAFEAPLPVVTGEVYWLVISNYSNSLSGFTINFTNSTNGFNFNIPNPLIWTGGASTTNWFDPRNWGNCAQIPDSSHSCIVAASSFYQPVINAASAQCKSITINSGATLTLNTGYNLDVFGNYNNQGSIVTLPSSGITLTGGATQTLDGIMVTPSEFFNLTVNKTSKSVTTNQHIECEGSFVTSNGSSSFNMSNNNLTVGGNFTNYNGSATFNPGTGTLIFDGSSAQTFSNTSGVFTLNNVTLIHSGSGVTLASNMNLGITGVLTLSNGKIITNGNMVTITNPLPQSVTVGNTTSYVEGNLRRYIQPTGSYDFPVGYATKGYQRANFNFTTATSINHLTAFFTPYSPLPGALGSYECNVTYNMPPLDNGFWTVTANANSQTGKYTATLYNLNYTNATGATASTVMSAHGPGGWQLLNGDGSNGNCVASPITAVTRQNMSGFSNFGTTMSNVGPLPIQLLSFTGEALDKTNLLTWTTATEINNDYFVPEKSYDGVNFSEMTHVAGAGNSNMLLHYEQVDDYPYAPVTYYKLKQVDFDGQFTYSDIIALTRKAGEGSAEIVNIYPNPAANVVNIEVFSTQEGYAEIKMVDIFDRTILQRNTAIRKGSTILTFDIGEFAAGVYFSHVKFLTTGTSSVKRFIKN